MPREPQDARPAFAGRKIVKGEDKRRPALSLDRVNSRIVAGDEVRARGPEGLSVINLNTAEDYQQALRRR